MKHPLRPFKSSLFEDKDDPSYAQETYNAFCLLALSNERGGNRDEVKNDLRAIPEVLTVAPVEPIDGGVQKQFADYFLSTIKMRIRLPPGADRDILTQEVINQINRMRGVSVRRHTTAGEELQEYNWQSPEHKKDLKRDSAALLRKGPNRGGPLKTVEDDPDYESAPPGAAGGLEETKKGATLRTEGCPSPPSRKVRIRIRPHGGELITSFEMQTRLNPEIWDGDQMRPQIRGRLQEIAEEFIEKLDLPNVKIKDIILTGSLANYNWSQYSDLDVHIVIDFKDIAEDEGFVKKYFDAVRSNWNRAHDIKVKGYEVELYVQDDDEKHTSTGVYSLLDDEWEISPVREEFDIDKVNIFKKARHIMRDIDKTERLLARGDFEGVLALGQRTKDKIKRMRSGGLERGGIYSTENLAFKVLRRGGYMGKLFNAVGTAYDAQKSLAEQE